MDINNIAQTILLSIATSIILGRFIIPILRKQHIGQNIRDDGPQSHLTKQGTPTMGGVIIGLTIIIGVIIARKFDLPLLIVLISTFCFGAVGFIDDFLGLILKRSMGLDAKQKILLQIVFSIIMMVLLKRYNPTGFSIIRVPFIDYDLDLGLFAYIYFPFLLIGTVNAVNLTDGLDGLLSSVTVPILPFLFLVAARTGMASIQSFILVLLGAILGFLVFNSNKASVFMGDTGSMTIGGAIAGLAIITNTTLFLPIFGIIYVIEAGSVIIQVISYKTRNKKRVFLMSPIHHHYELKGYNEQKIVTAFTIVSTIAVLFSTVLYF